MKLASMIEKNWVLTTLATVVLYIVVLNQWYLVSGVPFEVKVQKGQKTCLTDQFCVTVLNEGSTSKPCH